MKQTVQGRWPAERAWAWQRAQGRKLGCNYIPAYAVNQLEMWQADTFDADAINRELGWARAFGLNSVRVYLHDLLWEQDAAGFIARIHRFLEIAQAHGISVMLVFFDDCWQDHPRTGRQPEPVPGKHNSGWAMSPGSAVTRDPRQWPRLEAYVRGIVREFGNDERVILWDVYNEVSNRFMGAMHAPWWRRVPGNAWVYATQVLREGHAERLMIEAFRWVREENPLQPVTAAEYFNFPRLNAVLVEHSDVVSFHNYDDAMALAAHIDRLQVHGRPLVCSEWMSRPKSVFATHLPVFRQHDVSCYCWGLVTGKTNTRFGWQSLPGADSEPEPWFHDVLRDDGSAYDPAEQVLVRAEGLNR